MAHFDSPRQHDSEHTGFDADNPTYDQTDTSWSHFYDNSFDWDPKTQIAAVSKLKQLGKHDEIVEAILNLDDPKARSISIRKAMSSKVKFNHEDFENLQDELPADVYQHLATFTGFSAECPDYDKDNHTWKYFYENGSAWTEELQLAAISVLKTFGGQKQIMEVILELDADAPERALVEIAIKKNIVFSRESLQLLDGSLPDDLFAKLLNMAGIPEDDLYKVSSPNIMALKSVTELQNRTKICIEGSPNWRTLFFCPKESRYLDSFVLGTK